jgi:hypothetical protein
MHCSSPEAVSLKRSFQPPESFNLPPVCFGRNLLIAAKPLDKRTWPNTVDEPLAEVTTRYDAMGESGNTSDLDACLHAFQLLIGTWMNASSQCQQATYPA